MNVAGSLIFEGEQLVSWIKEDKEEGLIDMVFDTYGKEIILSFEPDCFEAMAEAIDEYREKGETTHDPNRCQGRIRSDLYLSMNRDNRVKMEVDIEENADGTPIFKIWSGKERLELIFSTAQAKEIMKRCEKIVQIEEAKKEVQKSKVVNTRV